MSGTRTWCSSSRARFDTYTTLTLREFLEPFDSATRRTARADASASSARTAADADGARQAADAVLARGWSLGLLRPLTPECPGTHAYGVVFAAWTERRDRLVRHDVHRCDVWATRAGHPFISLAVPAGCRRRDAEPVSERVDVAAGRAKIGRPALGMRARCSKPGRVEVMEIQGAAALVHA